MFKDEFIKISQEEILQLKENQIKNVNIGIMGHVDSGKTSISKILTTIPSTNSLDHNPISEEKGITIDLGFSCFVLQLKDEQLIEELNTEYLEITLVDCPGHSSFIKSVISGAQIIDMMILVIDSEKGLELQTGECIALADLLNFEVITLFNKIDLIPEDKEETFMETKKSEITKLYAGSNFKNKNNVSVNFFTCEENFVHDKYEQELLDSIIELIEKKENKAENKTSIVAADHSFSIKGKGEVLTGTVLKGEFQEGDKIYLPEYEIERQIKSIESFKKSIEQAKQGDWVAFLVSQIPDIKLEWFLITKGEEMKRYKAFISELKLCEYYKQPIKSGFQFHLTLWHENFKCKVFLYSQPLENNNEKEEFEYIQEVDKETIRFYDREENLQEFKEKNKIMCLFISEKEIFLDADNIFIASEFDFEQEQKICRIAFTGVIEEQYEEIQDIKQIFFRKKLKLGKVLWVEDSNTIIVQELFNKQERIDDFINKEVTIISQETHKGIIESSFGSTGKIKVFLNQSLESLDEIKEGDQVELPYVKYLNLLKRLKK